MLHADVSWPRSELIRLWTWSVDFLLLASLWLGERAKFEVAGHFLENAWGNGLIFCMPMYSDHIQNWLDYSHVLLIFSCDQAALWRVQFACLSVCPSVRLSHLFHYVSIITSSWNFQELLPMTQGRSMQKVKVRGQMSRSQRSKPNLAFFRTVTPVFNSSSELVRLWSRSVDFPPFGTTLT